MQTADIVRHIITSDMDTNELNSIIRAVNEKRKITDANKKAIARATFTIGMPVKLMGLSPKALNGIEGTISRFNQTRTRADITVTKSDYYKYGVGQICHGIPVQCFEDLSTSTLTNEDSSALLSFAAGS